MERITVEHHVAPVKLDAMGVDGWPLWRKEVASFEWTYQDNEICYILDGEAVVTPLDGAPVTIGRGDLVTFPAGLSCTWKITSAVTKHYRIYSHGL
jgi:uncharacterized cupin superfamily protein